MRKLHRNALVPHSAAQMYALVNDIESYPRFLPFCTAATITCHAPTHLKATVAVAKGKIRQAFTTENTMEIDRRIEMQLIDGPFKHLHGIWRFDPVGDAGCQVSLEMDFEFASRMLAATFGKIFNHISNNMMDIFCQRAKQLYG